jgi:hypothetical protein
MGPWALVREEGVDRPPRVDRQGVMANLQQLGEWSNDKGVWEAASVHPAKKPPHTEHFTQLVPKRLHSEFVNFGAYDTIEIEFENVLPSHDEIVMKQVWLAPLHSDTKHLLFTHLIKPDAFEAHYNALREQDMLNLPAVKVDLRNVSQSKLRKMQRL